MLATLVSCCQVTNLSSIWTSDCCSVVFAGLPSIINMYVCWRCMCPIVSTFAGRIMGADGLSWWSPIQLLVIFITFDRSIKLNRLILAEFSCVAGCRHSQVWPCQAAASRTTLFANCLSQSTSSFCANQPSWIAKQTLPRQLPKSVLPQSTDYFTASSTVKRLLQFLLPPVPHVHYFLHPRSRDSTPLACSLLLTVTLFYECKPWILGHYVETIGSSVVCERVYSKVV